MIALPALLGACCTLICVALLTAGTSAYGPADGGFHITVPRGWRALGAPARAAVPGNPAAVLQRGDRAGLLVVRPAAPPAGGAKPLAQALSARLARRLPGFRPVSARATTLRSGATAFVYTFAFGRKAETIALAPGARRWYELDAIASASAPDAAAELGAAIGSFSP